MWESIRSLKDQGITVLMTTHYMEEAEALCDRVAIIDHGKILVEDTPEKLKNGLGIQTVYGLDVQTMSISAKNWPASCDRFRKSALSR